MEATPTLSADPPIVMRLFSVANFKCQMFCYIWEYVVKPEFAENFIELYGTSGAWVNLFSLDQQYIRTDLIRDQENSLRFITVDHWTSKEACYSFRESNRKTFEAIDTQGDRYTVSETFLGDFDVLLTAA
jgi:hypothetical protein